jgi:prolyl-tRNA editing enzyme YbaK/EbsC (Cys-tRNA(Pro) deacylase)
VVACDPDYADTFPYCEKYGVPLEDAANTILVASKRPRGKMAACVLLATTRLDVNHRVKRVMGVSRLSFASADLTKEVTGMEIGGVNPFGLGEELPLLIDSAVMEREEVLLGAGVRTAKIFAHPQLLAHLPNATVVDRLAHPYQPPQ